jgi:hypothetical protein
MGKSRYNFRQPKVTISVAGNLTYKGATSTRPIHLVGGAYGILTAAVNRPINPPIGF